MPEEDYELPSFDDFVAKLEGNEPAEDAPDPDGAAEPETTPIESEGTGTPQEPEEEPKEEVKDPLESSPAFQKLASQLEQVLQEKAELQKLREQVESKSEPEVKGPNSEGLVKDLLKLDQTEALKAIYTAYSAVTGKPVKGVADPNVTRSKNQVEDAVSPLVDRINKLEAQLAEREQMGQAKLFTEQTVLAKASEDEVVGKLLKDESIGEGIRGKIAELAFAAYQQNGPDSDPSEIIGSVHGIVESARAIVKALGDSKPPQEEKTANKTKPAVGEKGTSDSRVVTHEDTNFIDPEDDRRFLEEAMKRFS